MSNRAARKPTIDGTVVAHITASVPGRTRPYLLASVVRTGGDLFLCRGEDEYMWLPAERTYEWTDPVQARIDSRKVAEQVRFESGKRPRRISVEAVAPDVAPPTPGRYDS